MLTFLKDVYALIPHKFRRKTIRYLVFSLLNLFLDLVSVAYIIPVIIFLIDKEKLRSLLEAQDIALQVNSPAVIYISIAILLCFYIIKNLIQVKLNTRLFDFLHAMASDLSSSYLMSLLKGKYLDFQQLNKGKVFQDLMKATTHFSVSLIHSLILLLTEGFFFLVLLLALGYFYPIITLGVFTAALGFGVLIYFRKKKQISLINNTYNYAYAQVNSDLINILDGYLEIRGSGNYAYFLSKFNKENKALNRVTGILLASSQNYSKYLEIFLVFGIGILVYSNFLNPNNDQIVLVALIAAFGIKIIPSLGKILNALTLIKSHSYSVDVLKLKFKEPLEVKEHTRINKEIDLQKISFDYNKDHALIDGLNLHLRRGEISAITGVSGIGKTTLLHLLMGLIPPDKGVLYVDNNTLNFADFSPEYGYVTQQPFLFNGTILENIIMGQEKDKIDRAYLNLLIDKLELKHLVDGRAEGLYTEVNHNSLKFSGGQKQRFAIARALYQKPDILILDEATNQQNLELESVIFKFIKQWTKMHNVMVVTVSHSENVFNLCDHVFQMEDKALKRTKGQ